MLSDLPNSDDEEDNWSLKNVRNQSDDAETLSETVDKGDAVPKKASNPEVR